MLKSTKIILGVIAFLALILLILTFTLIANNSELFALPLFGHALLLAPVMFALDRDLKIKYGTGLGSGLGSNFK